MKFNLTHAAIGVGVVLLLLQAAKRKGTTQAAAEKARSETTGTEAQAAWWTFAGKWNGGA